MKKLISFRTFKKNCRFKFTTFDWTSAVFYTQCTINEHKKCCEKNCPVFKKLKNAEVKR